jgi:hypothetical protein
MPKPVHQLTPQDFIAFPVWEYDVDAEAEDGRDETWVRPVQSYPVSDLANRVIGTLVTLNNGCRMAASLGNIDSSSEAATREFLTLSLWFREDWIDLARYFDVDYDTRGPQAFSKQLDLKIDEVFPILYDISQHAQGLQAVLRGSIDAQPKFRLSDDERMALIL